MDDLWVVAEAFNVSAADIRRSLICLYWTKVPKQNDILHREGKLTWQRWRIETFAGNLQSHYLGSVMMMIMMHVWLYKLSCQQRISDKYCIHTLCLFRDRLPLSDTLCGDTSHLQFVFETHYNIKLGFPFDITGAVWIRHCYLHKQHCVV